MSSYRESAQYYDAFYERFIDHRAGVVALRRHIARLNPAANTLVEAACGTGLVLERLAVDLSVSGFDLSAEMIEQARKRLPGISLAVADMTTWATSERFDVIVCVGSSIGYVQTDDLLRHTVLRFADHLAPDGVLMIEPWFPPEVWEDGRQDLECIDEMGLKMARLSTSARDENRSVLHFDFLIGVGGEVKRFAERHVMGLFTDEQMRAAFTEAGLTVERDATYPSGRGLYVGQRRSASLISRAG